MINQGRLVINVAYLLLPIKLFFVGITRGLGWAVALTGVGALLMRIFGGFGYHRTPLRYGASDQNYRYGSVTVRERPRWAARLLGWTAPKLVKYISDDYKKWYQTNGNKASKRKELQHMFDMFVIRRELRKPASFVVDGKGERYVNANKTHSANTVPQAMGQVFAQSITNCSRSPSINFYQQ